MFAEKIYALRKKSGLSQEQLAAELHLSRQAISKWEAGVSLPEPEHLIALSNYFHLSVDELVKEESSTPARPDDAPKPAPGSRRSNIVGLIVSLAGVAGLLIWGLAALLHPAIFDSVSESSVIQINGNGLLLIGCAAAAVTGVIILLKGKK